MPEHDLPPEEGSFTRAFLGEVAFRIVVVLAVMLCSYLGSVLVAHLGSESTSWIGALAGLAVGVGLAVLLFRWRSRRS